MTRTFRPGLVLALLVPLVFPLSAAVAVDQQPAPVPSVPAHDVTDPAEAKRVDSYTPPPLKWTDCLGLARCATLTVPLDYDKPEGPKVDLSVTMRQAMDPERRIGVLIVNPGGPGVSTVNMATGATAAFPAEVAYRFDTVGLDPRGVGQSAPVSCFSSEADAKKTADAYTDLVIPRTPEAIAEKKRLATDYAAACAAKASPMINHMTTSNYARDIDVLRRAMGERTVSVFGFSYGTVVGQYYANMFPDRTRAAVGDGVLDASDWAGDPTHVSTLEDRIGSGRGAHQVFQHIMSLCNDSQLKCAFYSAESTAQTRFAEILRRLRAKPLLRHPLGNSQGTLDDQYLLYTLGSMMYSSGAPTVLTQNLALLWNETKPNATPAEVAASRAQLQAMVNKLRAEQRSSAAPAPAFTRYDAMLDPFWAVQCGDAVHPKSVNDFPAFAAASDAKYPGFGPVRVWSNALCAQDLWKGVDPTAYRGPWNKRALNPLLFIGNDGDPATAVQGAVRASQRSPGAGLVTSNAWGHTSSKTSQCVTDALSRYLVDLVVPQQPLRCLVHGRPFINRTHHQ